MDWKKLFSPVILERGYEYYCDDAVQHLTVSDGCITADVLGSEDYDVEISIDEDNITEMYCSCPFASGGNNCKHMAAVLYAWEEEEFDDDDENAVEEDLDEEEDLQAQSLDADLFLKGHTLQTRERKLKAIRQLAAEADSDDVREFLISILMDDEKSLLRFYSMVRHRQGKEDDVERYLRQVDDIVERHVGRNGFIDYYGAGDFISDLEEILYNDVRRIINQGNYMSAFKLVNYIFLAAADVNMDDSDGGLGMLADTVYGLWAELIEKANGEDKREMFHWFIAHLDGSVIDYMEDYIENILMNEFQEDEFLDLKLAFVQEKLDSCQDNLSGWHLHYEINRWALRCLDLLKEKKASNKEIQDFCKKYWESSEVRKYYIDLCVRSGNYKEALKVLDESIFLDKEYRGLVNDYHWRKKDIYQRLGNKDAYLQELWDLELKYDAGNLHIYRELKKQYSEDEWLKKREELFQKLPKSAAIEKIYEEEKLYGRLLEIVLQSPGLAKLEAYTNVLKKDYPQQILEKYRSELNKMASYSGDRKKYRTLVSLLRSLNKIQGGAKIAAQIANDWRQLYKNRSAMMDELKKL